VEARVLDILNPTEDDVKLLTTMVVDGYENTADYHIDRLNVPALRQLARLSLRVLAEVKSAT
jgi:hypothetical protein